MPSAPGGDLQTLMDDDMVPYERDAVKFVRQVLEGLLFLHERSMAHLDIKVHKIPSSPFFMPSTSLIWKLNMATKRIF